MVIILGQIITLLAFPGAIFMNWDTNGFSSGQGWVCMKCVTLSLEALPGMLFMRNPKSSIRHFLSLWAHVLLVRLFAYLVLDFLSWRLLSILGLKHS